MTEIKKILEDLENQAGYIKVTCLGEKKCRMGFCDALLRREGATFKLETGIYFDGEYRHSGRASFRLSNAKMDGEQSVIVNATHINGERVTMRLERKTEE